MDAPEGDRARASWWDFSRSRRPESTGESLPVIYLGFRKAFDIVAHKRLIFSVSKSVMERELLQWEGACRHRQDRADKRRASGWGPEMRRLGFCGRQHSGGQRSCPERSGSRWPRPGAWGLGLKSLGPRDSPEGRAGRGESYLAAELKQQFSRSSLQCAWSSED